MLPTTAFCVCSTAPVATTSIALLDVPTCSLKSTRAVCAADSATVDWTP
jgi:hypothetical protein